jgi:hypothetical protein
LRRTYSRLGRNEEAGKELELYNVLKAAESKSESSAAVTAKNAE